MAEQKQKRYLGIDIGSTTFKAVILDADGKVRSMLGNATTLPAVALCDSFGSVFFLSEGYNTSLGEALKSAISKL